MPTPFLETPRFPYRVAFGFSGGPGYSTSRAINGAGKSKRNVNWTDSLGVWNATQLAKRQDVTDQLIAFFRVVKGSAYGFRFRDWSDYSASVSSGILTALGGGEYQMYKRYTVGSFQEDRLIQKPVPDKTVIAGGGSYTLDTATGIVTHTGGAAPSGWSGEFDVPCVFGTDRLDGLEIIEKTRDGGLLFTWGNIPIEEIRL